MNLPHDYESEPWSLRERDHQVIVLQEIARLSELRKEVVDDLIERMEQDFREDGA